MNFGKPLKKVKSDVPLAKKGVLDLRFWDFQKKGNIHLDGEWTFYWNELLTPKQLQKTNAKPSYQTVPRIWQGYQHHKEILPAMGYATYQLKVKLSDFNKNEHYVLKITELRTASKMWINGKEIYKAGVVGRSKAATKAQLLPAIFPLEVGEETLDIVVQISNYGDVRGGMWKSPELGESQTLAEAHTQALAFDMVICGILFIMGLYHFARWITCPQEKHALFFALFALILTVRGLIDADHFLYALLPNWPLSILYRIEYLTFYLALPLFVLFIAALFPKEFPKWYIRVVTAICLLFSMVVLVTPVYWFTQSLIPFQIFALIASLFAFAFLIKAVFKLREGAFFIAFGTIILISTVLHDILLNQQFIHGQPLVHFGLFGFVLFQSIVLATHFGRSFNELGRLSNYRAKINKSMNRFVPHEFLRFLDKESITEVELGDQIEADMTVFFSDIRDFTTRSEGMSPKENFEFINDYLSRMESVVTQCEGFIDKYIGDSIMALFPKKADHAVACGIEMLNKLKLHNQKLERMGQCPIDIGIGVNTGYLMLGTIGGKNRMESTVISDTVNLASRMEGLTKKYNVQLLITENTYRSLQDLTKYAIRMIDCVKVKGKNEPIVIYEVFDNDPFLNYELKKQTREQFEEAVQLYQNFRLTESLQLFRKLLVINPSDSVARIYVERISDKLSNNNHPDNWTGVEVIKDK
ncbi:MAG: adenylate/guanylate cyclase domain-containing protein [Chitinophagales bacterium]